MFKSRPTQLLLSAIAATTAVANVNAQLVDVALRPTACGPVGSIVCVDIYAITQTPPSTDFGALDVILAWNPLELELLGSDSTAGGYAWLASGFFPDPDGINANLLDGDAIFTALARPTAAAMALPAPGLRVTSVQFRPLIPLPLGSSVQIVASQGAFARTEVYSFAVPGLSITGNLGLGATAYTCPFGTRSCAAINTNSTGSNGLLTVNGSPSVLDNNLTLTASQIPMNVFGFFVVSQNTGPGVVPPLSQGTLCLVSPIGRGVGNVIFNSGPSGTGSTAVDLNALVQPMTFVMVQPGESWTFQAWHRDVNPGITSNFTDAVTITFE